MTRVLFAVLYRSQLKRQGLIYGVAELTSLQALCHLRNSVGSRVVEGWWCGCGDRGRG